MYLESITQEIWITPANFLVIIVPADDLAPNGARSSAGKMMTKYG